jgi:hypothetical protein
VAKGQITALFLRGDEVEWSTVTGAGGRVQVSGSGTVPLAAAPEPEDEADAQVVEEGPDVLGARLAKTLKAERLSLRGDVTVGFGADDLLLRVVQLPSMDENELQGMVELQVDKFSPFPVEGMVVSHEILASGDTDSTVLIAAVREDAIDRLERTLAEAGLSPARVDAAVMGWWHLLQDAGQFEKSGWELVVLMDEPVSEIVVLRDGVPVVLRALARPDGMDEGQWFDDLAGEVAYTFVSLDAGLGPVEECPVTVWHRDVEPTPLAGRLTSEHTSEVRFRSLEALPTVTVGLARRTADQRRRIDLTPAAWRAASEARTFKKKVLGACAVLVGVWAFAVGAFFGGLSYQERDIAGLEAEFEEWRLAGNAVRDMRRRVSMIERYTDREHSALECLRETAAVQTPGVVLSAYSFRKREAVKLSGLAGTVNKVYDFKKKLDDSPLFPESTLQGPRYDPRRRKQVFDIEIKLPGGEQ